MKHSLLFNILILLCIGILLPWQTSYADEIPVLKGSASRVLSPTEKLEISLNTMISSDFSKEGDSVTAKILIPHQIEDPSLIALRGALLSGHIEKIKRSGLLGRNGYLKIRFNNVHLANGVDIPVNAEMSSEDFTGQEALKTIWSDMKLMGHGALWGTTKSFQWLPVFAFTTEGLSLAIGAGVGFTLGTIGSIRRQGESRSYLLGGDAELELLDSLSLSDQTIEEVNLTKAKHYKELAGLDIQVLLSEIIPAEQYEKVLRIEVELQNNSEKSIYPVDLLARPLNGDDVIVPDLCLSRNVLLGSIPVGGAKALTLYYPVNKQATLDNFNLVLLDPITKDYLAEVDISVDDSDQ